ncbi:hypothetical protein PENVUL_c001G04615 [Penicillium vulpinum]|uniref:Uncharacterized protein n=1 Tax=Penicillium vulpinum TaxID=29845 RepID=A0A1V6SF84_9EURO|nr:hypothetical protein PENVUL_c001G04615 [Penicillium vulpinum]
MPKFLENGIDWHGLLEDMCRMTRESTMWRARGIAARPEVRIGLRLVNCHIGRGQWIEKEAHDSIYGEGKHPLIDDSPGSIPYGVGILKDAFEPNFERLNVNRNNLIEMSIAKS